MGWSQKSKTQKERKQTIIVLVACPSDDSMKANDGECRGKIQNKARIQKESTIQKESRIQKVPESVRNFLTQKKQKKKSKTKRESQKGMSELDDSDDYDIVIESITFI